MKSVETEGKTIDQAVKRALEQLNRTREEIEVEILEEPTKGILGILGSRQAKIRVTVKEDPLKLAKDFLTKVLSCMEIKVHMETQDRQDYLKISMSGENLGILIGRRGETLDALQYLTNLIVSRKMEERIRIILDVEGYRQRRENTLINLAKRLSERVKKSGNKITLEPMNPHERRVIHTALQNEGKIYTFSEGEDPNRKVVIAPKK